VQLFARAADIVETGPAVLGLTGTHVFIRDVYGHLLELFRIVRKFSFPPRAISSSAPSPAAGSSRSRRSRSF
jgi:hypothetical protein